MVAKADGSTCATALAVPTPSKSIEIEADFTVLLLIEV
jgi:hypothetical protein